MIPEVNPLVLQAVTELREATNDIVMRLDLSYAELIHTIASALPAFIGLAEDAQDADEAREKLAAFLTRPAFARAVTSWNNAYRQMAEDAAQQDAPVPPELAARMMRGEFDA